MANKFLPKVLICCECREEFVFTVEAQEYFAERRIPDDPKRCKSCHNEHIRVQRGAHAHGAAQAGAK